MNHRTTSHRLVAAIGAIQIIVAIGEMFAWPLMGWVRSHTGFDLYHRLDLTDECARSCYKIIANAGLYNGFLGVGLVWTWIDRGGSYAPRVFLLSCVVIAGVVGTFTLDWGPLFIQALPAGTALAFVFLAERQRFPKLGVETIEPFEEENVAEVLRLSNELVSLSKPIVRGQHAKATGAVRAKFIVESDLPTNLRVGIFASPRGFDAIIRFSNGVGRIQPDGMADARGMAIKLLDVDGDHEIEGDSSQDFVMINFPAFPFRSVRQYAMLMVLRRNCVRVFGTFGSKLGQLLFFIPWHIHQFMSVGRKLQKNCANVLGESYWSMSAYRIGGGAMKFMVKPATENLPALSSERRADDFLTQILGDCLKSTEARFDFYVQQQADPVVTPIEDPCVIWSESIAPIVKVATVVIGQCDMETEEMKEFQKSVELMAFNPWHCLREHRPLGGINRLRKAVYQENAMLRAKNSGEEGC